MADYVLLGLTKRRAWLAGEIENTYARLRKLVADLEALDATLLQFDPSVELEAIKPKSFRPPSDWAHRGEMSRLVLSILRQASEPMTTQDIAVEMLVTRALDRNDQKLLRLMIKRVGVALRGQQDNGLVQAESSLHVRCICYLMPHRREPGAGRLAEGGLPLRPADRARRAVAGRPRLAGRRRGAGGDPRPLLRARPHLPGGPGRRGSLGRGHRHPRAGQPAGADQPLQGQPGAVAASAGAGGGRGQRPRPQHGSVRKLAPWDRWLTTGSPTVECRRHRYCAQMPPSSAVVFPSLRTSS